MNDFDMSFWDELSRCWQPEQSVNVQSNFSVVANLAGMKSLREEILSEDYDDSIDDDLDLL